MVDRSPAHFQGMPRWAIIGIVFSALVLGSLSIGSAWKQSVDARAALAFGQQDAEVIGAISKMVPTTDNEALVVHALNTIANLKGITNYQALGVLAVGAGAAFLAIGFALFLIGADGAFKLRYEGNADNRIAFYATAPGLLCFLLSALLIGLGVTRKHDLQLGDYQSEYDPPVDRTPSLPQQRVFAKAPVRSASRTLSVEADADVLAHFCFDRILARNIRERATGSIRIGGGRSTAITPLGRLWINGATLRVAFLDGDLEVQRQVQKAAIEWSEHANLKFEFVSSRVAELRVSFSASGNWSYIGTDARTVAASDATMSLGGLTRDSPPSEIRAVVLHQFGHAIGLEHEHANPSGGLRWNEEVVTRVLASSPIYLTEVQIRRLVFDKYSVDQGNNERPDSRSIMVIPIPKSLAANSVNTSWNPGLSDGDKQLIGNAKFYPGKMK